MRTLKAVNERYEGTGYSVERGRSNAVMVMFEGECLTYFPVKFRVPDVIDGMAEMSWLQGESCEIPEVDTELLLTDADTIEPFETELVLSLHDALELGFCFQEDTAGGMVRVFRPDGTYFSTPTMEKALEWISNGAHDDKAPRCPLPSVLSNNVPTTDDYWNESEGYWERHLMPEASLLTASGIDTDTHWVDPEGAILTLDGEVISNVNYHRW